MTTQLIQAEQQAIEALNEAVAFREGGRQKAIDAINALRTAIQQAESEPVAWMASYVDPIGNDHVYVTSHHDLAVENDMHGTPRPLYTHPAPGVPEFSRIAKRKLDELQEQGFTLTGYAIQRGTQHGFITNGGFVGWWRSDDADAAIDAAMLAAK